ncbi:MAG: translation initiation factor eIF-2B [bacterium]
MNKTYLELLKDVTNDRRSGAWGVARKAITCLDLLAKEMSGAPAEELVAEVERVGATVLKAQPAMAQLTHLFNTLFVMIENEPSADSLVLSRKISGEAKRFYEHCENAVSRAANYGAALINEDSMVLVHSNSSTIFETITAAHNAGKTFEVLLSESRPILEGRTCARDLAKLGIPSTYFVDAAIAKAIERADIILLGADTVFENTLINKIGSRAICLLSREAVVPCYAACESSKFISRRLGPKREPPRDPAEVWEEPPPETTVENTYFEEVALELFNGIITEEGIFTPEEIGGRIRSQKMSPKLFELLK